jgi:hypothetical protein
MRKKGSYLHSPFFSFSSSPLNFAFFKENRANKPPENEGRREGEAVCSRKRPGSLSPPSSSSPSRGSAFLRARAPREKEGKRG